MSYTRLGTKIRFDKHEREGLPTVYAVKVTRVGGYPAEFRIAPENPMKPSEGQGWRVDKITDFGWEAMTPDVYVSATAAAVVVVAEIVRLGAKVNK